MSNTAEEVIHARFLSLESPEVREMVRISVYMELPSVDGVAWGVVDQETAAFYDASKENHE